MENIYLVSTNNVFINDVYSDINSAFPSFHKKENRINKIVDKNELLNLISEDKYDFIVMDTTIISANELIQKTNGNNSGIIWIVDSKLETQKYTKSIYFWNSLSEYKEELYRLGMSNPEIMNSNQDSTEPNHSQNHMTQQKLEHNQIGMPEQVFEEWDESPVISIAPPYPTEIDNKLHSKMLETNTVDLNLYPSSKDSKKERIQELLPYIHEYFSLVTYKEFMSNIDKGLAATLEMYEYINLNRSIKNKSIGVWSPIQGIGVTTFVMNFAFHIGQRQLPISVMEALKEHPVMYRELERISARKKIFPKNWLSYVAYINQRKEMDTNDPSLIKTAVIDYKGVYWFPLGKGVDDYRNSLIDDIPYYVSFCHPKEVVLIDLPNGEFKRDTRKLIKGLDELWVLLDGSTDIIFSYINYLEQLQTDNPNLSISLILLDYFPYISKRLIKKTFEFPIITVLPDLNNEVRKNKYEHTSIIENKKTEILLRKPFSKIGKYIYSDSYDTFGKSNRFNGSKSLAKLKGIFV